ncbi:MAG: methyltransferase domain-containing protein [Bacteroidetes bacterium]|nr:methyltransferase domain-containing protein [Bacteroidota bacterium]
MDFRNRSNEKELLDRDDIPFNDIKQNMHELNIINSTLGGHQVTLHGLQQLIGDKKEITICEIGCGGGDNLYVLKQWCEKNNIKLHAIGVDINSHCIEYARSKTENKNIEFITSDYQAVHFQNKPDIIFSSLFCHHFTSEELLQMLAWMRNNATTGFFINDLHRNFFAYHSIKWITRFFSRSYLVKNDAPLSVLRGFSRKEWVTLLQQAGIKKFSVQWKWAFRWLIIAANEKQ